MVDLDFGFIAIEARRDGSSYNPTTWLVDIFALKYLCAIAVLHIGLDKGICCTTIDTSSIA